MGIQYLAQLFPLLLIIFFTIIQQKTNFMGTCSFCITQRQPKSDIKRSNKKQIKIVCPICENLFDTNDHQPLTVLCSECVDSIKKYSKLKKKEFMKCPFCKELFKDSNLKKDEIIYDFLDKEKDTLSNLPNNMKKLYAFCTIYLPHLNKLMKQQSSMEKLSMIHIIRIKGKMLQEYEVFEMDMLDCLVNLQKIYLNNNQIKVIDTKGYQQQKLQLLDLTNNQISSMKILLAQNSEPFMFLKVLVIKKNEIEEIGGLNNLKHLQILNLSSNKIAQMAGLQGLTQLKELNLENNLIEKVEYYSNFKHLRSFFLFGNKTNIQSWQSVINCDWSQLSVLTLSFSMGTLLQKHLFQSHIKNKHWQSLHLVIMQIILNEELEDYDKLEQFGFEAGRLSLIRITAESYQFYFSNQSSFLRKVINKAKKYDKLGQNVNFTAIQFNKQHYDINRNTNVITKLSDNIEPANYLYHFQSYLSNYANKKYYIAFRTKVTGIEIGLCQYISLTSNYVQIDLQRGRYKYLNEERVIQNLRQTVKEGKQYNYTVCVDLLQQKLMFLVDDCQLLTFMNYEMGNQFRFYLNLKYQGSKLEVIKVESQ